MRLHPWAARWPVGKRVTTREYPLATGQTFVRGQLVKKDGSNNIIAVSGADPTPILGIVAEPAAKVLIAGKVIVHVMDGIALFAMQGDDAPVTANKGQNYGLAQDADGVWYVDGTDVVNTRVTVISIDVPRQLYFVRLMTAHRQA